MNFSAARRALTREQVRPSIPRRRRAPAPRALPPTKPSVPPRPGQSSPEPVHPFDPDARVAPARPRLQVRGQSSRGGAAPSHAAAPRDCRLSSARAPRRLPPLCPRSPRHCSSSAPRAVGGACVHGNGLPAGGQVSAVYSLSKSRARPQLGPGAGEGLASATLARESSVESEYGPCVWIDYCCAGYMCVVLCSLQAPMTEMPING